MTYMNLDIFPADSRDVGDDSFDQISGIYLRRTIRVFHVW
jgi:hypothetical protein